jgi:hypothetical protein
MRRPAALFPIVLALGAIILAPRVGAQTHDAREEGPTEIEKCRTIDKPGSYKLVKNLTGPLDANGDCLVITTGNVTINLAGFTISGPNSGSTRTTAIVTMPPSGRLQGIAVRNGSISGFSTGVLLENADSSIIEGLRVSGVVSITGVGISGTGILKGNIVVGIGGGTGVEIAFTGIVSGNYAARNDGPGIIAVQSTVIGNTAMDNGQTGFFVECPSNVTDNTATGNSPNLQLFGDGCNNTNNVAP